MNEIDNTNRHFKGQLETETVEAFTRRHWIVLIKDFFIFLVFIALLVLAGLYFKTVYSFFIQDSMLTTILAIGMIGAFSIYIHRFFLRIIRYYLDIIIITNYRIVLLDKSLFLRDSKDAIDLPKIQDIEKEQHGFLRWLLNYGTLHITLSSSSTTKFLPFIPNPDYHFRKINRVKRAYIKERLAKHDRPLASSIAQKEKYVEEGIFPEPVKESAS